MQIFEQFRLTSAELLILNNMLTKIGFQNFAPGGIFQSFDSLFLDLPDSLTGKIEFLSDFFKRMLVFAVQTKIKPDDICFTIG